MAHSRAFGSRRNVGSSRRLTTWTGVGPFSSVVQSATVGGTTLIDTGLTTIERVMLVRIHGELMIWLPVVTSIGDGFSKFHAGIGIVTSDAFTAGVASVPNPGNDADWPGWIWHHFGSSIIGLSVTESENTGALSMVRLPIDSKAMRKLRINEALFGSVQFDTEVGAATVSFAMNTRVLFKLA